MDQPISNLQSRLRDQLDADGMEAEWSELGLLQLRPRDIPENVFITIHFRNAMTLAGGDNYSPGSAGLHTPGTNVLMPIHRNAKRLSEVFDLYRRRRDEILKAAAAGSGE